MSLDYTVQAYQQELLHLKEKSELPDIRGATQKFRKFAHKKIAYHNS
jgi:hypothetical protein